METVTDPQGNAWYHVDSGGEIGDLCNFNFGTRASDGSNVTLSGHGYVIQRQWSNALNGCVLSSAGPSVPADLVDLARTSEPIVHSDGSGNVAGVAQLQPSPAIPPTIP
jgi:hypothetical protein